MDKPKLLQHQYAVGQAELATGYVLKNDGSVFHNGGDINETFEIFNSYDQAKEFCINKVHDSPEIECYVFDYGGNAIFVYDRDGERKI